MPLARMVLLAILLFFTAPMTIGSMILALIVPVAFIIWLPTLLISLGITVLIGYYLYRDFNRRRSGRKEYYPLSI